MVHGEIKHYDSHPFINILLGGRREIKLVSSEKDISEIRHLDLKLKYRSIVKYFLLFSIFKIAT